MNGVGGAVVETGDWDLWCPSQLQEQSLCSLELAEVGAEVGVVLPDEDGLSIGRGLAMVMDLRKSV